MADSRFWAKLQASRPRPRTHQLDCPVCSREVTDDYAIDRWVCLHLFGTCTLLYSLRLWSYSSQMNDDQVDWIELGCDGVGVQSDFGQKQG